MAIEKLRFNDGIIPFRKEVIGVFNVDEEYQFTKGNSYLLKPISERLCEVESDIGSVVTIALHYFNINEV